MMSAPAATSARPCATARSTSNQRPLSEKLSGVTLRTPMTSGRSRAKPAHGGRAADNRASRSCARSAKRAPGPASQLSSSEIGAVTEVKRRSDPSPIAATRVKARSAPVSGRARPAATALLAARPQSRPSGRSHSRSAATSSSRVQSIERARYPPSSFTIDVGERDGGLLDRCVWRAGCPMGYSGCGDPCAGFGPDPADRR